MAKIQLGGTVSAISGSIGGQTYSRNANGAYIRNKAIPTNTNTIPQQLARARFGSVSQIWGGLTDAQKQSFRDQVTNYPYKDTLGQSKFYTPSQLCNVVNQRIIQTNGIVSVLGDGLPAPLVQFMPAPVAFPFVEDITVDLSLAATGINFQVGLSDAAAQLPDGSILIVDATAPKSQGFTSPKASDYRNIFTYGSNVDVDVFTVLKTYYTNVFGNTFALNDVIYFRATVLNTDTGVYSTSVATRCSIAA
jgi:hypothetical protein